MGDIYDAPQEMTDEDLLALAGMGGNFGNLDTPPEGTSGLPPTGLEGYDPNAPFDPSGLEAYAAPDWLTNLSPEDYFSQFAQGPENPNVGPTREDPFGLLGYKMDTTPISLDTKYSGPGSEYGVSSTGQSMSPSEQAASDKYASEGRFNPSTGVWEDPKPTWRKILDGFLGSEDPIDPKTGKPIPRQSSMSSPASSVSGMASNAAAKAAESRAAEARILLEQDRNRINAEQLNLLREKFLRQQKAGSRARTVSRSYNRATPEEKAAAQADLTTYDPFSAIPENKLPGASWWEKLLAGYGTAGGMASGARSGNF